VCSREHHGQGSGQATRECGLARSIRQLPKVADVPNIKKEVKQWQRN